MAEPAEILNARVARRVVLVMPIVLGVAGCSLSPDPYIEAMKSDPMYSWMPTMSVSRRVSISPMDAVLERTSESNISIWLIPTDPRLVPDLLRAAQLARSQAGYPTSANPQDNSSRRNVGQVDGANCWIQCSIFSTNDTPNSAPSSEQSPDIAVWISLRAPSGP